MWGFFQLLKFLGQDIPALICPHRTRRPQNEGQNHRNRGDPLHIQRPALQVSLCLALHIYLHFSSFFPCNLPFSHLFNVHIRLVPLLNVQIRIDKID